LFKIKKLVQSFGRKDRSQEHAWVQTSDAINAPVPLNEPHRIPGNIQVDDVAALLKVDALSQYVSCYENVVEVGVTSGRCFR
jgi:hypothetical protein